MSWGQVGGGDMVGVQVGGQGLGGVKVWGQGCGQGRGSRSGVKVVGSRSGS